MNQGTPEWFAARCGKVTASRLGDVLAKIKSGEAAVRRNYRAQLISEQLTGVPVESFSSAAMQWGKDIEPQARAAYEAVSGNIAMEVGFIPHQHLMTGASPDGLIEEDGGIEIKCPNTATHIDTLLKGMSPEHLPQIQGAMWITGRQWWHFVSFDPRLPERLQLYVQRVERDQDYIDSLAKEVVLFLGEIDQVRQKLEEKIAV